MKMLHVNSECSFLFALKNTPHFSSQFNKRQLLFIHLFNIYILVQSIKVL